MPTPAPPFPSRHPSVIHAALAGGQQVCLRRITPADEGLMREGIARMSPQSRYLRFFSGMKAPPDWVIERLLDVDGDTHLAWGAIASDHAPGERPRCQGIAIGAVHAFRREDDPDCAEFSVAVLDDWHSRGVGRLLTATLLLEAQAEGIATFHVDTLAENRGAIEFTRALGGTAGTGDGYSRSFTLEVGEALTRLREECQPEGLRAVFAAFAA
ncbi:GNAT family N-acetyltransferase [Parerythrobacter lacustris]|uniref:GNAT family N-acetyltransferase n=1 Tax=Parerythrobacter lacustris TaxID=2969984 RepID=A0ABT1XPA2_9SPHN|nr:GNAT family N-acetyltransferase [Parerythrobacter lacustris]MCR2833412.1 GNAT family N-acetyltransferase [Parerythrobacter lacustris]